MSVKPLGPVLPLPDEATEVDPPRPRKVGPIGRHYLQLLDAEIREHLASLNVYRETAVHWASWCHKNRQSPRITASYVKIGETLGDQILVLEAKLAGIRRLMEDYDVDEGWS